MYFLLALLSLVAELVFGYPQSLVRAIGHPVMWIGKLVSLLDLMLNRDNDSDSQRRYAGVLALAVLLLAAVVPAQLVASILGLIPFGIIGTAVVASSLLAQRSLGAHVHAVATALETGGLAEGRKAVSMIVGRDPDRLDEAGVSRAAIESLAENFSDGVVAPAFWLAIGGLPAAAAYKAANTADSMIGHRSKRHQAFGWAAARFDDLLNLIPARLTALLIAGAAFFVKGAQPEAAWSTALADAKKHESPNAGWPEAAFAGALDMKVGGPRSYDGEVVELPTFGTGSANLGPGNIERALKLYAATLNLALLVTAGVALVVWRIA